MFLNNRSIADASWQAFERLTTRLLLSMGYEGVRLVGQSNDKGADVIASRNGARWLFQVKHWGSRVGAGVVDRTVESLRTYRAQVPVIVSRSGFVSSVYEQQRVLQTEGVPLQLWDEPRLLSLAARLPEGALAERDGRAARPYQEEAIDFVVTQVLDGEANRAMVVMATGLGKTFVAAETIRRIRAQRSLRVLAIAHTNDLVYQLERAFWPFMAADVETVVWNGIERPSDETLRASDFVFACLPTVAQFVQAGNELPPFDLILIDECHHVGARSYRDVVDETGAGKPGGPFLLGLTATPWRPDEVDLRDYFGVPVVTIDMVTGLRNGFLSNVDYRMYTDNIDWEGLRGIEGETLTPRAVNRKLFITQWDDGVVTELQAAWGEQPRPRAIVFCGNIDHALTMRDMINARGFCRAEAIYSGTARGIAMKPYERNRVLSDFQDGVVDVVCAVDIFNEGLDVPDVNILVFQRVTHSRRIFIQQLGRGLRIAPDKEKVIVLDFVSDIRRFAAGLELKDELAQAGDASAGSVRVRIPHSVEFRRVGESDPATESFLREWLHDVGAIEEAGMDVAVLSYPPPVPGGRP